MAIVRIQFRRDTTSNWVSVNPILALGEPAYDIDLKTVKYGDGITRYNDLPGSSLDLSAISATGSFSGSFIGDGSGLTGLGPLTLPSGVISGSSQITDVTDTLYETKGSGILSGSKTDISSLNTFTSSIQTEVNGLSSQTSSYLLNTTDTLDGILTVSGSVNVSGSVLSDTFQVKGGTGTQGTFSWNTDEVTVDLIQNGSTLQLGQELQVNCRNSTGVDIPDGAVVMSTGTIGASGRITIAPAQTNVLARYILGITTEVIPAGLDGKVTTFGKVRGIDTSAYAEGTVLYLTDNGGLSEIEPLTGLNMPLAFTISSHANNGTLMVRVPTFSENHFAHRDGATITNATVSGSFSGSFQGDGSGLSGIVLPSGLVSGSVQVLGGSTVLSGSKTDITSLNAFTSSIQTEVNTLSAQTSSYITSIPNGTVSGSSQLTSSYDTRYVISGSVQPLPSGLVSGSSQITDGSTILSGSKTDISSLNTFTSSIQIQVNTLSAQTSSYITSTPSGTVSGSVQISYPLISNIPVGIISGSSQITGNLSLSTLLYYSSSGASFAYKVPFVNTTGSVDGNFNAYIDNSAHFTYNPSTNTLTTTTFSGNATTATTATNATNTTTTNDIATNATVFPSWVTATTGNLPRRTSSTKFSFNPSTGILYSSVFSGSGAQLTNLPFTGITGYPTLVSGSSQISYIQLSNIPTNIVSGSAQITDGSTILSGSKTDISSLNTFTSSIQTNVNTLSAQTSSYITSIPNNLVSGSSQLTSSYDTRYVISGSLLGDVVNSTLVGEPSGSQIVTNIVGISQNGWNIASASAQLVETTYYLIIG